MIVNDIIKLAKAGALFNLTVADNPESMIMYTYLGTSLLYQRFNMSIKTETMKLNDITSVYELRSGDLGMVLSVYNDKGKELRSSTVTDSKDYDYKQLSYRTFLFREPRPEYAVFVYSATPPMFTSIEDPVDIPAVMIPALLDYVCYLGFSTVNTDQSVSATGYYQKFDKACQELEGLGYKVELSYETLPIYLRGFN